MKKIRHKKTFIFSLICVFCAVFMAFSCILEPKSFAKTLRKADSSVVVNITPYQASDDGNAAPVSVQETLSGGENRTKYIDYICFSATNLSGEVSISYTTIDRTAIASAGDYVSTSGTVKLNASDTEKMIGIEVSTTTFATAGLEDATITTRTFEFVITDIDWNGGNEQTVGINGDTSKRSLTCEMNYTHCMEAVYYNGGTNPSGYYYKEYAFTSSKNHVKTTHDVGINNHKDYGSYFGTSDYYSWINDYVNTGLANVYAGEETENLYNSWACSAGDVVYTIFTHNNFTDTNKIKELYYDYNRLYHANTSYYNQTSGNINSDMTISNFGKKSINGTVNGNDYVYINFNGTRDRNRDRFVGNALTDNITNPDKTYSLDDLKIWLRVDNDKSVSTYSVDGTVYLDEVLYDSVAPTFVTSYFDGDHAYVDGYVRFMIRFSEPVQVIDGDHLFANIKIGSSTNNYRFEYESGSGTDTLVFRYDIANFKGLTAMEYSSGSFTGLFQYASTDSLTASNEIGDFGLIETNSYSNCNRIGTKFNNNITTAMQKINNFHLNLNAPTASKTSDDSYSAPVSSMKVAVTVNDCNNGTIYYKWVKDGDTFNDYDTSMTYGSAEYNRYLNQYNQEVINNEDGYQTFEFTSNDENGDPLHGNYFLYVFVVSGNKKHSDQCKFGYSSAPNAYVIDSVAPEFSASGITYDDSANNPKSRSYSVGLTDDYPTGAEGVYEIDLSYKKAYGDSGTYLLWSKDAGLGKDDASVYDGTTLNFTVTPEMVGLSTNEYGYYTIDLIVKDSCGNTTTYSDKFQAITNQLFDTRSLFDVASVKSSGNDSFFTTSIGEEAYQITSGQTFTYTHTDSSVEAGKYKVYSLTYAGTELIKDGNAVSGVDVSEYVTIENTDDYTINVSPLKSGKMSISFSLNDSKYSTVFDYYFTNTNYQDDTANADQILSSNYVKSYVYQLSDNPYTYLKYDAGEGTQTESYCETSLPLSFSSATKALEYVQYMEKQDMCLVYLDESSTKIITALNKGGSVDYVKADGESTTAAAGQYWIRYKSANWSYSNEKWVYYYYGKGTSFNTINFSVISSTKQTLQSALEKVSSYITNLGSYAYLTTEDYENSYGQLYVNTKQIRPDELSVSTSKSGSSFYTSITYYGDSDVYCSSYRPYTYSNSSVKYDSTKTAVPFVMQYRISADSDTRFYYATTLSDSSTKWVEMTDCDGQLFDSYFADNVSGTYKIMELDTNGIHQFDVYIDHLAPQLDIEYVSSSESGATETNTLDYNYDNYTLGVTSISFKQIESSEADPYSYISIYKANYSNDYVGSYTLTDLLKTDIALDDGSYYLVVSDRFGNGYTVKINLNTEEMGVTFKVSEDGASFSVVCTREASQIYTYEIYNGETLVTSTYATTTKIYNSGCYFVKIKDIYGNEFDSSQIYDPDNGFYGASGYKFSKVIPQVTWRYYSDGSYVPYKEGGTDQPMMITAVGTDGNTFYVSTAVSVMLSYTGEYAYTWLSDKPEFLESSTSSGTRLTIEATSNWKLKIYYDKYPDVYVTYICEIDNTAPTVVAYYDVYEYVLEDGYSTDAQPSYYDTEAASYSVEDEYLNGSSCEFVEQEDTEHKNYIRSGDVIQANSFHITVSDDNQVASIDVKLNGEDYKTIADMTMNADGSYDFDFDQYGSYVITTTDIFGNSTSMQFDNKESVKVEHYVDDKLTTDNVTYGNSSDIIKISSGGEVVYMINDNQYIFYIDDSGIYQYVVKTSDVSETEGVMGWAITLEQALFYINNEAYLDDTWYQVTLDEGNTDLIYVKHDSSGFYIKVGVEGEQTYKVSYSVLLNIGTAPVTYNSTLSGEYNDVALVYADGTAITTNHNGDIVRVSDAFTFDAADSDLSSISRVRVSFSKTTDFIYYTTIYSAGDEGFASYDTGREGFYSIQITNIYGNMLTYNINESSSMSVETTVYYSDDSTKKYGIDYNSTIYTNKKAVITLYSANGSFIITKDGETYNVGYDQQGDSISATIQAIGEYTVNVVDEYGNVKIVKVSIAKETSISYKDSVIYGYNEGALGYNEETKVSSLGYTKNRLSLDYDVLNEMGITTVVIESSSGSNEVYNSSSYDFRNLTEEETAALKEEISNSLKEVIGTSGSGDYTIIFRDKYGNKVTKTIHYNEDGTLTVEVNYRSDTEFKNVTLTDDTEIYSNNSVKFTSSGIKGTLVVDGSNTECPLTLGFSSYDGTGSKDYTVTYTDEYGFSYTITVHLLRQEVEIKLDDSVTTQTIDEVTTTTDNIVVVFPEDTTCTYSLNGSGTYSYEHGQSIVKDGVYTFTAVDKAGNLERLTVAKDTSVQYKFVVSSSDRTLMDGGVVNGNVYFKALNSDSSYLSIIVKDGEVYAKDQDASTIFNEAGYYEVLVADKMGNKSTFTFYIISHDLNEFEYQVPYGYEITEAWITPTGGYLVSFMDSVDAETGFDATTDGTYTITLQSQLTGETYAFNFTIDSTPSPVTISGVEDGGKTSSDVVFANAEEGDTFYVYKDGTLVKTVTIESGEDGLTISEGGTYKVVIKNAAGVETTYTFTRTKMMNTAGSVLIIIISSMVVISLFAGLLFRKRSKIDK